MEEEKSVQEIATPVREGRCGHRPLQAGNDKGSDAPGGAAAQDDGSCGAENVGAVNDRPRANAVRPYKGAGGNDDPAHSEMAHNDRVEAVVRRWSEQAQETKKLYPGLDMARELRNPRFAHLLKSGVDVRTAFEVVHRDQILPAAMGAAAKAVEKKLTRAMADARPAESAMESASPALTKTDVAAMSKADRQDIIRRVQRGEIIRF